MDSQNFQFGAWRVDRSDNSISDDAIRHQMEPRAMDVLVALCEEPNTVVSTEQILEQCWGSNLYGDNAVHKTINQLRKILGDDKSAPSYIETIRKRGYRAIASVQRIDAQSARSASWTDSPFRGLQAFDEEHAPIFFGRNDAIFCLSQLISQQVRQGAALELFLVLGPSGSGKTSLVRAGLLPSLMQPDNVLHILSHSHFDLAEKGEHTLLTTLAGMLLDLTIDGQGIFPTYSAITLGLALQADLDAIVCTLQQSMGEPADPGARRHVLFLDRFEAVFDENSVSLAERQSFLKALDSLARSHALLVLIACRNDFYPHIAACPSLMEAKTLGAHFDLSAPSHAEVTQMIRLPALAARLSFGIDYQSNARLDDVLAECAFGNPDALPLLQYTLHELYRMRGDNGELSFAAFHELGGIEGAIGRRAEQVFHGLDEAEQKCLHPVLALVTTISNQGNGVTSRRAAWTQLANAQQRAVVNALVESRLFVSDLVDGVPGFGLAHEALLRRWPRVLDWIEQHRSALQVRARVGELAARWRDESFSQDLLIPEGKQLDEATRLLELSALPLAQHERALIAASSGRGRKRRRVRLAFAGAFAALVLLAGGLGLSTLSAQREAKERPAEVERLMNAMLSPTDQLGLSDTAKAEALHYFAQTGDHNLQPAELLQRPATLLALAEMFSKKNDPASSLAAAARARALLREQLAQGPLDAEVLDVGWNVSARFGRLLMKHASPDAAAFFLLSQDYAKRLNESAPGKPELLALQAKTQLNLGDLAVQNGVLGDAETAYGKAIEITQRALAAAPQDDTLNARLVDTMFRLGTVKKAQGAFKAAMQLHKKEAELEKAYYQAHIKDDAWGFRFGKALHEQAELNLALGNDSAALAKLAQAESVYLQIQRHDPSNLIWLSATINTRILSRDILARKGSSREMLAKLQQIDASLKQLWEINPDGRAVPIHALATLDSLLQTSIALRLVELGRATEDSQFVRDAKQRLIEAEVRSAEQVKLNPFDRQARISYADALVARASIERQNHDDASARQTCQRARETLASKIGNSDDFELVVRWLQVHMCLGAADTVSDAQQRLARIGYRDTRYLQLIGEKK